MFYAVGSLYTHLSICLLHSHRPKDAINLNHVEHVSKEYFHELICAQQTSHTKLGKREIAQKMNKKHSLRVFVLFKEWLRKEFLILKNCDFESRRRILDVVNIAPSYFVTKLMVISVYKIIMHV